MSNTAAAEMYRHNLWSTMRLLDACDKLTDEQLDTNLPGTFGSIRSTLLHWLRNEDRYVSFLRGEQPNPRLKADPFPGFDALRESAERSGNDLVEIAENLPEDPILRTLSDHDAHRPGPQPRHRAPHPHLHPHGRPGHRAARERWLGIRRPRAQPALRALVLRLDFFEACGIAYSIAKRLDCITPSYLDVQFLQHSLSAAFLGLYMLNTCAHMGTCF